MKKLFTALFALLTAFAVQSVALADAALPSQYYYARRGFVVARQWVFAVLIGIVIVAAAIIIMAVKYRREQNAADAAKAAARAAGEREPEDK
jgi:heme/copper-type cytochrome/quinol oxidase subunit 2